MFENLVKLSLFPRQIKYFIISLFSQNAAAPSPGIDIDSSLDSSSG
jgi:hypothetical protein